MEKLDQFKAYMRRINHYNQATRLIHWDLSTGMPKNAASANIDALTLLSTEAFKLQVADELTYNLHIIIRFEIEKALFNGSLQVQDLPTVWHDKMKEYLGVTPSCHKEGVLQDVHWPGGMFGYFPSYALGNIYSGQFLSQIQKELGNLDELLLGNRLADITQWMSTNVHTHGSMKTPMEIVQESCHSPIQAAPILKYYKDKYSKLYNL